MKVDDNQVPINYRNEKGIMRLNISPGNHQVTASFGETPIRLLADIISLFSLGLTFSLIVKKKND